MLRKFLLIAMLGAACTGLYFFSIKPMMTEMALPPRSGAALQAEAAQNQNLFEPEQRFRLKPDARFLHAVGELARLTGQHNSFEAATAQPDATGWNILLGNRVIGTLPDLPAFDEYLVLLNNLAGQWMPEKTPAATSPASVKPGSIGITSLLQQVAEAEQGWSEDRQNSTQILQALGASSYLALQVADKLQAYDALYGYPLAWLALCRQREDCPHPAYEALIAAGMGYAHHAESLALQLPETEPIRHYVLQDITPALQLAEQPNPNDATLLLTILTLGDTGKDADWQRFAKQHPYSDTWRLPALRAAWSRFSMHERRFAAYSQYRAALHMAAGKDAQSAPDEQNALAEMTGYFLASIVPYAEPPHAKPDETVLNTVSRWIQASRAEEVAYFEQAMNTGETDAVSRLRRAHLSALFYGALYNEMRFVLDELGSLPDTRSVLGELNITTNPGMGSKLVYWLQERTAMQEKRSLPANQQWLNTLRGVGHVPLLSLHDDITAFASYGEPALWGIGEGMARMLDSRPSTLLHFANILRNDYKDLPVSDRFYKASLAAQSSVKFGDSLFHQQMSNRLTTESAAPYLLQLQSQALSSEEAGTIGYQLRARFRNKLAPEVLDAAYTSLIQRFPENMSLMLNYCDTLFDQKRYQDSARQAMNWMQANEKDRSLQRVTATLRIVRALRKMNQPEKALELARQASQSHQASSLITYAELLAEQGQPEKARQYYALASNRYPNAAHVRISFMDFLWAQGDFQEAAKQYAVLKQLAPSNVVLVRQAARKYVKRLAGDPALALQAFAAFGEAGVGDFDRMGFTKQVRLAGHPEIAFEQMQQVMQTQQRRTGWPFLMTAAMQGKQGTDGPQAAIDWAVSRLGGNQPRNTLCVGLYEANEREMLWLLGDPATGGGQYPEYVWLMRAAMEAKYHFPDPDRLKILQDFYAGHADSDGPYFAAGRHLLGLNTVDDIMKYATDEGYLTKMLYYAGLRSFVEYRYTDAANWFLASARLGRTRYREYTWTVHALETLQEKGRYLDVLTAEPVALTFDESPDDAL